MVEILRPLESAEIGKVETRKLDPEKYADLAIAMALDLASTEAINPFAQSEDDSAAHETMSPEKLKAWMQDSAISRLRIIEVVDPMTQARNVAGFVYLYKDEDKDYRRRANELQEMTGRAGTNVWEMNIWCFPWVNDDTMRTGVGVVLDEFAKDMAGETTMVMFADAEDMQTALQEGLGREVNPNELKAHLKRELAEKQLQDARILLASGFEYAGRIRYYKYGPRKDFAYCREVSSE